MRRDDSPHSHPCAHCRTAVECHGELIRNHDGFPEVVCHVYHVCGTPLICEGCYQRQHGCHFCGEPSTVVMEDATDDATGYRGNVQVCAECYRKRTAA